MKKTCFEKLVKEELKDARSKHSTINSIHEGYAVILEELDEVWDEVKKKTKERNLQDLLDELVQVGAMAQKMAEDVVIPIIEDNQSIEDGEIVNKNLGHVRD